MGTWFKRPRPAKDVHQHEMPVYIGTEDIIPGDRYQCSCGDVFEVKRINQTQDGEGISWALVHAPGVTGDTRQNDYDRYRLPGESVQSYMEIR